MGPRQRQAGLTLVELLATLSILAILASLALPAWREVVRDRRLLAAAVELRQGLASARNVALSRARPVTACPSADGSACLSAGTGTWEAGWITFIDNDGDAVRDANDELLAVQQALPGSVTLRGSGSLANYVLFSGTGQPVAAASGNPVSGVFSVCDERGIANGRAVTLSAGGATASTLPDACSPS